MNTLGAYGYGYPRMGFGGIDRLDPIDIDQGEAPVLQGMQIAQQQQGNDQRLQMNALAMQDAQQQIADQQQINQLASQAYTTAPDQRNTLLSQMALIDPREAAAQQQMFAQMDSAKKAQTEAAMDQVAHQFTAIAQDPDTARQKANYAALLAKMRATGKDTSMYENVPPAIGAKMALAQIADSKTMLAMNGVGDAEKPQIADGYQIVTGADGRAQAVPIPIAGGSRAPAAAGAGFSASVPGANGSHVSFNFPPGTPPEVIAAAKADAMANGDVAPGTFAAPNSGKPATLADALHRSKVAAGAFSTLTPDQVAAAGLPKGTVAQQGPNGEIHVVSKAPDTGDSGMELLTPDGTALMDAAIAHGYSMPMPSMGYGKAGTAAKAAAINKLAEQFKREGISPDAAISQMIQGNTTISGLRTLQSVNAKISGFEQSAEKEADLALTASANVDRSGSPVFNGWVLAGRQGLAGSPEVTRFNNAVDALAEDYARVIGGGNPSATDSSRDLAHKMINSAMTQNQFAAVVDQMRKEMRARTSGIAGAVSGLRDTATAKSSGAASGWGSPQTSAAAPAPRIATNPQTGERVQWNGSAWVPAQ